MDTAHVNAWCCLAGTFLSVAFTGRTLALYRDLRRWSVGEIEPRRRPFELLPSVTTVTSNIVTPTPSQRHLRDTNAATGASCLYSPPYQSEAGFGYHNHSIAGLTSSADLYSSAYAEQQSYSAADMRPVDASTVLQDAIGSRTISNRPDRSIRGVRVAQSSTHAPLTATSSQRTVDSGIVRGVEAVYAVSTVKRLHNPINTIFVTVALIHTLQALVQGAGAIVTLVGAPFQPSDHCLPLSPLDYHWAPLPVLVCDASALSVQFMEAASSAMLTLLLCIIASRRGARAALGKHAKVTQGIVFVVSLVFAAVTAAVMWVTLPVQPWGSRFAADSAWCWIPSTLDSNVAGEALRFGCSYMFAPAIALLSFAAFVNINQLITFDAEWHLARRMQRRETRHHRSALFRRFIPLALYYTAYFVVSGLSRASSTYASSPLAHAIASFVFPLEAAVGCVLWAYGEGLTRVLIFGNRVAKQPAAAQDGTGGLDAELLSAPPPPQVAFSVLVADMYSLDFRSAEEIKKDRHSLMDVDWFFSRGRGGNRILGPDDHSVMAEPPSMSLDGHTQESRTATFDASPSGGGINA